MEQIRSPLNGTPLSLPESCEALAHGPLHPADELAEIRATILRLKEREDALLRFFREDDAAEAQRVGKTHQAVVTINARKVFDNSLLPQAIIANPRFYRTQATTYVTTLPADDRQVKPLTLMGSSDEPDHTDAKSKLAEPFNA